MAEKEKEQQLEEILEQLEDEAKEAKEEETKAEKTAEMNESDISEEAKTEADSKEKNEADEKDAQLNSDTKKKKSPSKKDKKDKKDEMIETLTDQVKRQMAEFENFRKRTDKEKSTMYELGAKSVVEKILPVIDNFERGLATVPESEKDSPFVEGMKMIYKQLLSELEQIGVKPIECVGQPFDPNFHNAVMQVGSEEYESGCVAQELQKGYMYRDSVVRHSMVSVVS